MTDLARWTGGTVGERDRALPLLTMVDGAVRVELSGATTANWVAKGANLLVDGLGGPDRVGVLLPLHWQTVTAVLAGVVTGAEVLLGSSSSDVVQCDAVLTTAELAPEVLAAGVPDVLVVSLHPMGAPLGTVPAGALDHARDLPGHGDHWHGSAPAAARVSVRGRPVPVVTDLGRHDRLALAGSPADAACAGALLAALRAGAPVLLLPDPERTDLEAVVRQDRPTTSSGVSLPGVRRLA